MANLTNYLKQLGLEGLVLTVLIMLLSMVAGSSNLTQWVGVSITGAGVIPLFFTIVLAVAINASFVRKYVKL